MSADDGDQMVFETKSQEGLTTVGAADGNQMVFDHGRQIMIDISLERVDQTIGGKTATTV